MKSRIQSGRIIVCISALAACLMFEAACKRTRPDSSTSSTTAPVAKTPSSPQQKYEERVKGLQSSKLSPQSKLSLMKPLEELRYSEDQEILDRKELVTPASADFKPEAAKRRIRLTLALEKKILRRGENPRFRLEMMNVGQEPIIYTELDQSFFKTCGFSTNYDLLFQITTPAGRQEGLGSPFRAGDELVMDEIKFPAGWTDAQKVEWARQKNLRNHAEESLRITIRPGETLRTRGDAPGDMFCALRTDRDLSPTGTYKIQVKFDDTPAPPSERMIHDMEKRGISRESQLRDHERDRARAIGSTESNIVSFEVAP